jgi:hypothetical protein
MRELTPTWRNLLPDVLEDHLHDQQVDYSPDPKQLSLRTIDGDVRQSGTWAALRQMASSYRDCTDTPLRPVGRTGPGDLLSLPENLIRFERDRCILVRRNDTRRIVARRTRGRTADGIDDGAGRLGRGTRGRQSLCLGPDSRGRFGIDLYRELVWMEASMLDGYLKPVLALLRIHRNFA